MKCFYIIFISLLLLSCSSNKEEGHIEYIKVMQFGEPDSITIYNKDVGLFQYFYFDAEMDSFIVRDDYQNDTTDTYIRKTYTGKLRRGAFYDTILKKIDLFKSLPNGYTYDTTRDGSIYCGADWYVEFKDRHGLHFYHTRDGFENFFMSLKDLKKSEVDNLMVNADLEVIAALKQFGVYDKLETPFIAPHCGEGIDKSKLFGSWWSIGKSRKISDYFRLTIRSNGEWLQERMDKKETKRRWQYKLLLKEKSNKFILEANGEQTINTILKLTDECFEFKSNERDDTLKYGRIHFTSR